MFSSEPPPPTPTTAIKQSESITTNNNMGEATRTISTVHPDILLTHIFSRLDGPALASASCTTTQLCSLSTQEHLWSNICNSTWQSTNDPRISHLISTFPNGHRSFFSDSFPLLSSSSSNSNNLQSLPPASPTSELISAIDIQYKNNVIYSKIEETKTTTNWFRCSPFRIDLLEPKDIIPTTIQNGNNICQVLNENLTLSWVMIDPIQRRSANLSSWKPVSVHRHWLSGEIQVRFATVLKGSGNNHRDEEGEVLCGIILGFGGCENGDVQVKEVSLQIEDMDGISLNGKDSLEILQAGIGNGERKNIVREGRKEKYEEYLRMKREREIKKLRREKRLDSLCGVLCTLVFTIFCIMVFYR
ncbi:hypothetical protein MKX01_009119 [Papaver californicum]|nr:hypothetical protein MKX01_009119 [Papaver californicum]